MGRVLAVCGLWGGVAVALALTAEGAALKPRVVMPVRSAPDLAAPVVCMLWPGVDAVRWDGPGATWRVGDGNGCQGFVNIPRDPPPEGPAPATASVLAHALNARVRPARDAPARCWMPAGTGVRLLPEQGDWVFAQAAGCAGYVQRAFVAPQAQTTKALAVQLTNAESEGDLAGACNVLERLVMREPGDDALMQRARAGCARVDVRRADALTLLHTQLVWDRCRAPGEVWCAPSQRPGRVVLGDVVEKALASKAFVELEKNTWLLVDLRGGGRAALVALARSVMASVYLPVVLAELEALAAFVAYAQGDGAWLEQPLDILLSAVALVDFGWAVGALPPVDRGAPTPPESEACGFGEEHQADRKTCEAQYNSYLQNMAVHQETMVAYDAAQGPVFVDRAIQLQGFHPRYTHEVVVIRRQPKAKNREEAVTGVTAAQLLAADPKAYRAAQEWTAAKALHRRGELASMLVAAWAVNVLKVFSAQRWAQGLLRKHQAPTAQRYNRFARAFNAGESPANPYAALVEPERVVEQLDPVAFRAVRPALVLMR
jgi:hypothetical protein